MMIMFLICVFVYNAYAYAAIPLGTTRLADVEATSWYLILGGFLAELLIMSFLLRAQERFPKILGVTLFMNAVSIFMGTVTVFGADVLVADILRLPAIISFAIIYLVAVLTSVATEVLIVTKIFPKVDQFKLILLLSLANIISIAAGMYGIWITRITG